MAEAEGASGASESDRILADGVPLTLAGGREARLRFTMRSFKALEDHFGSIDEGLVLLAAAIPTKDRPATNPKTVGTVVPFLVAGLIGDNISAHEVWDLVEISEMNTYIDVISSALDQALPAVASSGKASDEPVPSHGTGSTTPPPGASDAPTPGSGE